MKSTGFADVPIIFVVGRVGARLVFIVQFAVDVHQTFSWFKSISYYFGDLSVQSSNVIRMVEISGDYLDVG
jgi:hypothetical protein